MGNEQVARYVIQLPPVTKKNHSTIVTNRRTGRAMLIPSKPYKEYSKQAGFFLRPIRIDGPVNVKCLFYMQTRRRVDLTNLLSAVDDVLTEHGVVVDDNSKIIAGHDGSRVRYDKENPRTEIVITRLEE